MSVDDLRRRDAPALFTNRFTDAIQAQPIDYCDTHDLLAAVIAQSQTIAVFRINGQIAFNIARKDHDCVVRVLKWKPDGSLLGVGWSDGMIGVYSGEDGKTMSQMAVRKDEARDEWKLDLTPGGDGLDGDEEPSSPACVGWTTYRTGAQKSANLRNCHSDQSMNEDWHDGWEDHMKLANGDSEDIASLSRLSKVIAALDVTSILPRLSALPIHALRFTSNEQKFTTQAGVDTLFDANRTGSDDMTTFITSSAIGHTNVYLGDSVSLGHFPVSEQGAFSMIASHPSSSSQIIVSKSADDYAFHLDYVDLPLERLGGSLLHVVTTQTTRIQNLLAYITQTLRCMQSDLTSNLQLPSRIIANIAEELSSQDGSNLVSGLYHLAMTGIFSAPILEWLTESIRENTHKRWDKAVNDMYNHIQNHIFVNLIPALDRLAIAAEAIRGHARAHEGTDVFISPDPFTHIMDDAGSLRLVAQKLQLLIITEHRQFRAFSKWLRVMIEVGSAGPGSKAAIETEEREVPNIDYFLVLAYIKETLMKGKATSYLEQRPDMKGTATEFEFWNHPAIISSSHQGVVAAIQAAELNNQNHSEENLTPALNLPTLAIRLAGQARLAIASITQWQSAMLSPPQTIFIDPSSLEPQSQILDVKMYPTSNKTGNSTAYLLSTLENDLTTQISFLRITRDLSQQCNVESKTFPLPTGHLLSAKFLRQDFCIVLLKQATDDGSNYVLLSCELKACNQDHDQWISVLHSFPEDAGFVPGNFIIGGRPGKMVCVVCAADGKAWKVLDLDQAGKSKLEQALPWL